MPSLFFNGRQGLDVESRVLSSAFCMEGRNPASEGNAGEVRRSVWKTRSGGAFKLPPDTQRSLKTE